MAYYTWSTELDNYWLRLPQWVRDYKKGKVGSMQKAFEFNWRSNDRKVKLT